ncbi:MAG: alpha/beta fold hydrolase, partial [Hyphococcus sp.]
MPDISVNGITLHYETAGSGPPLLLIAGFASDCASWAPVAPLLAKRFTLIMPDNRGCGRTRTHGRKVAIDAMADDCAALLDHLSIERAP